MTPPDESAPRVPPEAPVSERPPIIARGEAQIAVSRALDGLTAAVVAIEAVSMAIARQLDDTPTAALSDRAAHLRDQLVDALDALLAAELTGPEAAQADAAFAALVKLARLRPVKPEPKP
jgi:hypothetical protein